MSSLQQPNRFRTYLPTQGVLPQSLSGSETDVSTSNENLSHEERYVIRHTARQEPQGQENLQSSNRSSLKDSLPSNRSSLDVSSSSYNTLIIHSAGDEPWTGRNSGIRDHGDNNSPSFLSHQSPSLYHDPKLSPIQKRCSSNSPSPSLVGSGKDHSVRNSLEINSSSRLYSDGGVQEITDIPDDYLNQSHVLKHLAKEVKVPKKNNIITSRDSSDIDRLSSLSRKENRPTYELAPPPEYPICYERTSGGGGGGGGTINRHKLNPEKLALSKSQPDLSRVGSKKIDGVELVSFRRGVSAPRPRTKGREEDSSGELWPSAEIVEILIKENSALKQEVDNCYQKISKSQKLEQEIQKVQRGHEDLVQSCERRERLERAARGRLQGDCRRLQELNRALREQVDLLSTQLLASRSNAADVAGGPEGLRRELNKREVLIAQLITQNKELVAAKERQEIELAAQRATLQEQRTHIDILDTALTNAQGNVVRLEEENRKKQIYVERVAQLQRALSSLQLASDRREQTERKLRLQLERELQRSRGSTAGEECSKGWDSPNGTGEDSSAELKRRLREREEKIMRLEGECSKWEQRYLEENALRQAAIDAASIPKDAKIAALEKTSQETEKIIAEARSEKIRHMDEVHAAQKKVADLESRLKDLESKLAERDAMIRVLQKHTYDKDVSSSSSYPSMLGRSPHHTPHPSLGGADLDTVLGTSVSREELVSSVLTNSTGFGSSNSYAGSDSSYHLATYGKYETNKSFDSTKKTLDDQLKEIDSQLDSQLLSKRGLCCFPGFSNPVTASRKGKLPKPLLAGVSTGSGSLYEAGGFLQTLVPPSRHESGDMLLLEKQGRSSQQQRMQEAPASAGPQENAPLPPSSLPRPPRRSGLPRRLGEYGRLADHDLPPRKKSDGGDSLSSNASSRRASPARSLIPPPRKLGEYGRLSETDSRTDSRTSLRKVPSRPRTATSSVGERDSASTLSDNSASSLPPPSKLRMYAGSPARRGSSLGRENKNPGEPPSSSSTTNKYRIQF